jgi:hypothetical protein
MGSVLMGCVGGEVVKAGASKNESATEGVRSVSIGDEAGVGKNEWGEAGCVFEMWQMGGRHVGGRG